MSFLHTVKHRIEGAWAVSYPWLAVLLLGCLALANGLGEPRTIPFAGYIPDPSFKYIYLLTVGVALLFSLRSPLRVRPPFILALLGLPTLFWLQREIWVVPITILAVGSLAAFLVPKRYPQLEDIAVRLNLAALMLLVLPVVDFAYEFLTGRLSLAGLSRLASGVLPRSLSTWSTGSSFAVEADGRAHLMILEIDRLGGLMLATLFGAYLVFSLVRKARFIDVAVDLGLTLTYVVFATLFVTLQSTGRSESNPFLEYPNLWKLLPAIAYMGFRLASPSLERSPGKELKWRWAVSLAGAAALAFSLGWWPNSEGRKGTIVFDEHHSDWEPTDVPLSNSMFGSLSVYNYYNLYGELGRFYSVGRAEKELGDADFDQIAVLVLKTPTRPYSKAFCDRVVRFVERGGGLWLVGDHTDAFGMTTYLNPIANRFGCEFEKNAFVEPPTKRNLWRPNEFTDPAVANVSDFLMYTGCSLRVPVGFRRSMVARRQVTEMADYSAGSFFGPLRIIPANPGGNAIMAAMGEFGKGRVALWSDSTLFSNFALYMPGKRPVAMNTMEWLRRGEGRNTLRASLGVAALLCLAMCPLLLEGYALILAIALGLAYVPGVTRLASRDIKWYDDAGLRGGREVVFLEPKPTSHFAVQVAIDDPGPDFYMSAFVAAQRVGARPALITKTQDASEAKVMVHIPNGGISQAELQDLNRWVRSGGRLVVLDSLRMLEADADRLGSAFGLPEGVLTLGAADKEEIVDNFGNSVGSQTVGTLLSPDITVLSNAKTKKPCAGWYRLGKGWLFLSASYEMFSDEALGDVHTTPNELQYHLFSHLFRALDEATDVQSSQKLDIRAQVPIPLAPS